VQIAVIGAGPAGAWAAYRLAQLGARVTIFDGSHPREKPCGGGVTGRAIELIDGAIEWPAIKETTIRRARFTSDQGEASVALADRGLVVASRTAFDAALLDAALRAGATLFSARVTDVDANDRSVTVRTGASTLTADFLIGADGANSLVRRRLAQPFRRDELSIATGFFAQGVTSDEIVLEMTTDPPGYIWSFPRGDHLAIGICAQADSGTTAGALRTRIERWIEQRDVGRGAALVPYSWPIPSLAARRVRAQRIAGPHWCLVGDAAGLVDPITREGIFFALASGGWAADAIAGSRDLQRAGADYARRVRRGALDELAHAARLKDIFFRPALTALLLRGLRESAGIRAVMADLIAGTQPYRGLKLRLLGTGELGLAVRALRSLKSEV
jgi:geranylgeranyl reductase family protein